MVMLGNGYNAQIVDSAAAVLTSNLSNLLVQGVYVSVYGAVPMSLPSPRPSAIRFNPPALSFTQNVGTTGTQTVTITNFGGSPMSLGAIVAGAEPSARQNNCPPRLTGGSNCAVTVTYAPRQGHGERVARPSTMTRGTRERRKRWLSPAREPLPAASVSPSSLGFGSVVQGATSSAKTVTVMNSGTGPLQITQRHGAGAVR